MSPRFTGYPTSFAFQLWSGSIEDLRCYLNDASADLAERMRTFPDMPGHAVVAAPSDMREYFFDLTRARPGARLRGDVMETDSGGL